MVEPIRTRGKKVELTPEQQKQVLDLHKAGKGFSEISELTGYSRWTVSQTLHNAGAKIERRGRSSKVIVSPKQERPASAFQVVKAEAPQGKVNAPKVEASQANGHKPSLSVDEAHAAEVERRVAERVENRVLDDVKAITSATELSTRISAAHELCSKVAADMTGLLQQLEELWEKAEKIAQIETGLVNAVAQNRVLKQRIEGYERKLKEMEQRNIERALAISGS